LKYLNSELGLENKVVPGTNTKGNSTKVFKIIAIIEARQKLIAMDPGWVAARRAKVLVENGGSGDESSVETFEDRVQQELGDTSFFSFYGTLARLTYAAKIYCTILRRRRHRHRHRQLCRHQARPMLISECRRAPMQPFSPLNRLVPLQVGYT
jgi:hypothetical protein